MDVICDGLVDARNNIGFTSPARNPAGFSSPFAREKSYSSNGKKIHQGNSQNGTSKKFQEKSNNKQDCYDDNGDILSEDSEYEPKMFIKTNNVISFVK